MYSSAAQTANRQIARSALIVAGAFVVSQLCGLVAKSLIGSTFGAGAEVDAFFAANRFTDIIFNLVAGGALASAFVPTFTGLLTRGERTAAWRLASSVANGITLILILLTALSAVFAPWIVRTFLAPGFDPGKQALTAELLRIQLPAAVIFGLSGLVMGILNAHQRFLLPALTPAMYQLGLIFGAVVLSPTLGIRGLGWGVVAGAGLHLLLQLPGLFRLPGQRYQPGLDLGNPQLREVARLMGPRLLGVAVVQLNFWLNTYLASLQPEGSLAGINYAFPLMIMPQAAIAQSIAIAALPTFSAQAARGQLEEMRASLAAILRGVLLLAIPASVGLVLLRNPVVSLIYERQSFDSASVQLVAWGLLWYAVGLVGHCVVEIVSRAFYAVNDTRTPVTVGVAAMSLNILFSLLFSAGFNRLGWMPHGGLALANSLATGLEMVGLLILMRRRLSGLDGSRIRPAVFKASAAALGMSAGLIGWLGLTNGQGSLVTALGGVVVGGGIYFVLLAALRAEEIGIVYRAALRRIKHRTAN